jgi:hypothetical protein
MTEFVGLRCIRAVYIGRTGAGICYIILRAAGRWRRGLSFEQINRLHIFADQQDLS